MELSWSSDALLPLFMLASLFWTIFTSSVRLLVSLPAVLLHTLFRHSPQAKAGQCTFYDGDVYHVRRLPTYNSFRYPVRLALINLDDVPGWWSSCQHEHLTAKEARQAASTEGTVLLLTNPSAAGYTQNPISVYYCMGADGTLQKCIAKVTNTPWGASVTFLFDPAGQSVPKALHVSPFMDMQNTWKLKAPLPDERLHLSVGVSHPKLGDYFNAVLTGRVSQHPTLTNEQAGWRVLLRYGFQPQRVACLIYWQAVKLLWKGIPFISPPDESYKEQVSEQSRNEADSQGRKFAWVAAEMWPWNAQQ
ncbi:hypothetical protein WJX73_009084 [Symbiochloris irregularis]|uniref:DUF1365-domain-containing protein n=1 Tax=Symbiochloris irregularis TaxID=706552 RepID=A0AAW1P0F7_9CHLO